MTKVLVKKNLVAGPSIDTLSTLNILKVQILDVRSGRPIRYANVHEIKIGGLKVPEKDMKTVTKMQPTMMVIDDFKIEKNFIIYYNNEKKKWFQGKSSIEGGLKGASKYALYALGYISQNKNTEYTENERIGYNKFLKERMMTDGRLFLGQNEWTFEKEKLDSSLKKQPTNEPLLEEIIKEYNTPIILKTKFYLSGYALSNYYRFPDEIRDMIIKSTDDPTWNEYWAQLLSHFYKKEIKNEELRPPVLFDATTAKTLKKFSSKIQTNSLGILNIPIQKKDLNEGCKVKLSLNEFPLLREALLSEKELNKSIYREQNDDLPLMYYVNYHQDSLEKTEYYPEKYDERISPTNIKVSWRKPESIPENPTTLQTDDDFGWRAYHPGSSTRSSTFQKRVILEIPQTTSGKFLDFHDLHTDKKCFSTFYDKGKRQPEFVLFALQWAPPSWNDLVDPLVGKISNESHVQDQRYRNVKMHLSTHAMQSNSVRNNTGLGKYYGIFKNTPPYPNRSFHNAIDLFARKGDLLFAIHGGIVDRSAKVDHYPEHRNAANRNDYALGKWIRILFILGKKKYQFAHSHMSVNTWSRNKRILTGSIVGRAGRTGNLVALYPGHSHIMIRERTRKNFTILRNIVDESNKECIPHNEIPLALPCACDYGGTDSRNPHECSFNKIDVIQYCWAARELACPYMKSGNQDCKVQAQLKSLGYYNGDINGDILNLATRGAIQVFRNEHNLNIGLTEQTHLEANDQFFRDALDAEAPLAEQD